MDVNIAESETVPGIPTAKELIARAEALLPVLRERAEATERNRQLSDETAAAFRAAGFHKIMQPARFGGYALGQDVGAEIVRTIASACGSSGWVANLFMMHNWQASLFSLEAQQEYWSVSHDVFCSTGSAAPRSEVTTASGGFRLSGRWKFSSGSDFADWFIIMKVGAGCLDWFMVPRRDVTLVDDWFVAGLCGTGSKDIVLDEVFVPSHRVLGIGDLMMGTTPGGLLHGSPYGAMAFPQAAVWGIPAALIGMATGMAEAVRTTLMGKRALFSGEKQVERVANQMKLAEAHMEIHAAELILRHRLARLRELGERGAQPEGAEALASLRDAAYVGRMMGRVASGLGIMAGATSVYLANPVQRYLRDVNVGITHVSLVWEEAAEAYGRALWNLPPR